MITDKLDPLTGLPLIKETRGKKPWASLPRDIGSLATVLHESNDAPWHPAHHVFDAHVLKAVTCWKCGVDLKGWRMALDRFGNQIEILNSEGNRMPAVAFLDYDHRTSTPFAIRLPKLDKMGVFNVHHCQDCTILVADGMNAWACCLGGTDAILNHATNQGTAHISRDVWATYLYRFGEADPQGPTTKDAAMDYENILSPGDILTSAALSLLTDSAQRNKIPSGVVVSFKGGTLPMGWKQSGKGKIEKL